MSGTGLSGLGRRVKGAAKELVAEATGDAALQDEGRRDIAADRAEGAAPGPGPRRGDPPPEPAR